MLPAHRCEILRVDRHWQGRSIAPFFRGVPFLEQTSYLSETTVVPPSAHIHVIQKETCVFFPDFRIDIWEGLRVHRDDRRHVTRQDAEYGAGHWLPAHRPALYGRNSRKTPSRRRLQPSLLLVSRKLSAATAARERSDFILAHDTPSPRRPKPQSWLGSAAPSRPRI